MSAYNYKSETELWFRVKDHSFTFSDILVLLVDYITWSDPIVYEKLRNWCASYNSRVEGIMVYLPDEETFLMFKLTWGQNAAQIK